MATQACTCIAGCNACICGSLPPVPHAPKENPLVAHAKILSQFNNVWLRYGRGGSWDF